MGCVCAFKGPWESQERRRRDDEVASVSLAAAEASNCGYAKTLLEEMSAYVWLSHSQQSTCLNKRRERDKPSRGRTL